MKELLIFDGLMNSSVYMGGFQYAINTYFQHVSQGFPDSLVQ